MQNRTEALTSEYGNRNRLQYARDRKAWRYEARRDTKENYVRDGGEQKKEGKKEKLSGCYFGIESAEMCKQRERAVLEGIPTTCERQPGREFPSVCTDGN